MHLQNTIISTPVIKFGSTPEYIHVQNLLPRIYCIIKISTPGIHAKYQGCFHEININYGIYSILKLNLQLLL